MDNITNVDILQESKNCFLTYCSEVLTDRAIPAVEDGLLSAQRKILWTMEDYLKMDSKSKTRKCNAIVGSTLATSYYHGDLACYGVLCKMSQDYLMRYPLIKGQGSLGTQENNDMVASSRYTEAKPSIFADLMMNNFKKEVVPMKETYNGEFMEPIVLPSLFPNAICNGRQAIGISMSHNSASHNLIEVCNAAIAYINNNSLSIDELLEIMPGPDFPLGGTVLNIKDVRTAFATGKSNISLKIQGDYEIDGQTITFKTIPYRTYRNKIKEQIEKNIDIFYELIEDYDDASAVGQNCLIFYIKPGISPTKVLNKLFLLTDLQTTLSYNMNYIVNGTPKLCSMLDLIKAYVDHQENILIKATEFDKIKAEARAHILRGLITAVDAINEVILRIKTSSDRTSARESLKEYLDIDDIQANAILDMKLGKLTKIDKQELIDELKEKEKFIAYCLKILNDKDLRNAALIDSITKLRDTYGDARRTKLLNIEIPKAEKEIEEIIPEDCIITINYKGVIKKTTVNKLFKTQRKNDTVKFTVSTNTLDYLMVFTTKGKVYKIPVNNIPENILLSSLIDFEVDEVPIAFTTLNRNTTNKFIIFATKNGLIKKVPLEEYNKIKRTGVKTINLKEGDCLAAATFINQEKIMLFTKNGMTIQIDSSDIPISSKIAQGVKGIKLNNNDYIIAISSINNQNNNLIVISNDGLGKKVDLKEFSTQGRGGKGVIYSKNPVAGIVLTNDNDNILIIGDKSSYSLSTNDLPLLSRTANGNKFIKNNNIITSVIKI